MGTYNKQFRVDDVAGATDLGFLLLGVRDDALATLTPADGDYAQLRLSAEGALWAALVDAAGAEINPAKEDGNLNSIRLAAEIMDDWDESNRAAVNLIVGQAGIAGGSGVDGATVPRVTLATNVALPAGTNTIGKVDVLSLPDSIDGPGAPSIDSFTYDDISVAADTTGAVLATGAASKQIWVYAIGFTADADGTVNFFQEDTTAITNAMNIVAGGGMATSPSGNFAMPMWKLGTNQDFKVTTVDAAIHGWFCYAVVSV